MSDSKKITSEKDLAALKQVGREKLYPEKVKISVGLASCGLAAGAGPLNARCQRDEYVAQLDAHWIRRYLGSSGTRPDVLNLLGELLEQKLLDLSTVADGLLYRNAGQADRIDDDGLLGQTGDEHRS